MPGSLDAEKYLLSLAFKLSGFIASQPIGFPALSLPGLSAFELSALSFELFTLHPP